MNKLIEVWRTVSDYLSTPLFKLGTAPISTSSMIKLAAFLLAAFWVSKVARLALERFAVHFNLHLLLRLHHVGGEEAIAPVGQDLLPEAILR